MKCIIPPKPLTEKQEEKQKKKYIRENDKILKFADHLQLLSLHENLGFGIKRMNAYNDGAFDLGQWYIERYSTEKDHDKEYAVTSYFAMRQELIMIGWNPDDRLWEDDIFETFLPDKNSAKMRLQHTARLEYAKGISFYVREMLCITAIWLHHEKGIGQERLDRVFKPVVKEYLDLMRHYLRCNLEGDTAMVKKIAEARKKFNDMGLFKEER